MRLNAVHLSWFRGAGEAVSLDLNRQSHVVYGANGSGKSSFVDAVEYALRDGRIGHLSHEYSGRHQEKGVLNTHRPSGHSAVVRLVRSDDTEHVIRISDNGGHENEGSGLADWDYRSTVLRQDEVAAFIHDTKGRKYSALLPLLGLGQLEVSAENVRKTRLAVERQSQLDQKKGVLQERRREAWSVFGDSAPAAVHNRLTELVRKYCPSEPLPDSGSESMKAACGRLAEVFELRARGSGQDQQRFAIHKALAQATLDADVQATQRANVAFADQFEPLVVERLKVLEASHQYARALTDEGDIECPACGTTVQSTAFRSHVDAEHLRLNEVVAASAACRTARARLAQTVASIQALIRREEMSTWFEGRPHLKLAAERAAAIDPEAVRMSCDSTTLSGIAECLPLIAEATIAASSAPPDVVELVEDRNIMLAVKSAVETEGLAREVREADNLVAVLLALEEAIRERIRTRSEQIITDISADIQRMWAMLHPGEPIEHIKLFLPSDAEKAIDIGLSFFGVEQDSPRLTLSEGHRNSLGLCIFLAMARRDAASDLPLFLDDVVVSLDRGHRGMIVDVLEREFSGRQVVVLTHDREWYTELRQLLDPRRWAFKALLPYDTPEAGIRWSHKTATFDDARAHLAARPDSAGNDARKIMDVEMSLIAERLQVKLSFLRGHKNDHRMAHEFLSRIIADGKRCLQIQVESQYVVHKDALDRLSDADRLLQAWANRASHTFDIVASEAAKLIDACEAGIRAFFCSQCDRALWFADAANDEFVQCQCGQVRWRYGKT